MNMEKIRAVLFDFGGVLAEEGFRNGLFELARGQKLDPEAVCETGREVIHESGYILGKGSEGQFWQLIRERTGLKGSDRDLSDSILARFILRPRMLEFVRLLRSKGFITAIVSDQTDWLERLDRREGFFREFNRVFNSFRLGKCKLDPSLFDDVAQDLAIAPAEALFTDDTSGHVVRAESRGMHGILFDDEDRFRRKAEEILGI